MSNLGFITNFNSIFITGIGSFSLKQLFVSKISPLVKKKSIFLGLYYLKRSVSAETFSWINLILNRYRSSIVFDDFFICNDLILFYNFFSVTAILTFYLQRDKESISGGMSKYMDS